MVVEKDNNLQLQLCFALCLLIQWHLAAAFLFVCRVCAEHTLYSYPQSVFMCLQLHVILVDSRHKRCNSTS